MKGLLIKDFKTLLTQKQFFLILFAFSVFLTYTSKDPGIVSGYMLMCLSILTLNTMSYDETNGGMSFILSLPTTRLLYVKAKYILAVLLISLGTLVSVTTAFVVTLIKGSKLDINSYVPSIVGCVFAASIILILLIPIQLKVGAEKARVALFIVIAAIAVIVAGVYKLLSDILKIDIATEFQKIMLKLSKAGNIDFIITGVILLVIAILFAISYVFSVKIINKKEY